MSRFARAVLWSAVLAFCLVVLPLVSKGQEVTIDSQGRSVTTIPPRASSPSLSLVKPDTRIPEGTCTIYSNFGSGHSYNDTIGWTEAGPTSVVAPPPWLQAMAFTPTKGTYLLTQLDLAIGNILGTNGYKLELDADDHGKPGRRIAKWAVTGLPPFGTCCSVETIRLRGLLYWRSTINTGWFQPSIRMNGRLGILTACPLAETALFHRTAGQHG
jgi:hypothetical protein